jgi:release factor glutamine methyltransferase
MNYLEAINYGNKLLKSNNIKNYSLDSELLLAKVLKSTREKIIINLKDKLRPKKLNHFKEFIIRRQNKEPMAYILNTKEFWKNSFFVNNNVLIPRPETEIIVQEVLNLTNKNSSKQLLDVGTGSGCIILSVIKERPKCYGIAIDISKKALNVAIDNAKIHHLQNKIKFINNDIDKFNYSKYDIILSNPPYIKNSELIGLESNIKLYEPKIALGAGVDGLREIKKLITKSKKLLKLNGKLIFEIGNNQLFYIMDILRKNSFYINKICYDLQNYPRVIISTKLN